MGVYNRLASTSVQIYQSVGRTLLIIGGESDLIGSIFDVFSSRLL